MNEIKDARYAQNASWFGARAHAEGPARSKAPTDKMVAYAQRVTLRNGALHVSPTLAITSLEAERLDRTLDRLTPRVRITDVRVKLKRLYPSI